MFFSKLVRWIFGYWRVRWSCGKNETADRLIKNGVAVENMTLCGDGGVELIISHKARKSLLISDPGIFDSGEPAVLCGLPGLLIKYRRRPGIVLGAMLFLLLLKTSELFVWEVTVSGNECIGDAEIVAALEERGFGIGTYIPAVDFHKLCNSVLIGNDGISWISVNLSGTTAQVQVIEKMTPDTKNKNNGSPCNIVASRGGYILRTQAREGHLEVRPGETVKKGQLLISGVNEYGRTELKEFRFVHADGSIFAETFREFRVDVSLDIVEKTEIQREILSKSIKFFSKTVKIYEKGGILSPEYDKIRSVERITLFEDIDWLPTVRLPIFIIEEQLVKYGQTKRTLTENEARAAALRELSDIVEAQLPEAEILERSVTFETENGVLLLSAELRCVEDIAKEQLIGLSAPQNIG